MAITFNQVLKFLSTQKFSMQDHKRIKMALRQSSARAAADFTPGEKVEYQDNRTGAKWVGVVTSSNMRTVGVNFKNFGAWRMAPSLLTKVK